MSASPVLFCEGLHGGEQGSSLDLPLIDRLVPTGVVVEPAGSKNGIRAYALGYFAGTPKEERPSYLCFRDRDFDMEPGSGLGQMDDHTLLTRLASVENYLLDPALLARFWAESARASNKQRFVVDANSMETWLREAAQEILYYQAARWTLSSIRRNVRLGKIPTSWVRADNKLPENLSETECLKSIQSIVDSCMAPFERLKEQSIHTLFAAYIARFQEPGFFQDREYLIWFHGKNLLNAMNRSQPEPVKLQRQFLKRYMKWAVGEVDLQQFVDLMDLKQRLNNMLLGTSAPAS